MPDADPQVPIECEKFNHKLQQLRLHMRVRQVRENTNSATAEIYLLLLIC